MQDQTFGCKFIQCGRLRLIVAKPEISASQIVDNDMNYICCSTYKGRDLVRLLNNEKTIVWHACAGLKTYLHKHQQKNRYFESQSLCNRQC